MATAGDIVTGVLLSELAVDDDSVVCDAINQRQLLILNVLHKKKQNRKKMLFHLAHAAGRKIRRGPPVRRGGRVMAEETDANLDHDYANGSIPRFCVDEFEEFRKHFNIRRSTFNKIVSLVEPKFGNQEKSSLPIQRKVLVSMWLLSCKDSFKTIGDKFGLQKSTTYYAFMQFVSVLHSLSKEFIFWPDSERLSAIAIEFQKIYKFPGVLGVLSTCRIPIKLSLTDEKDGSRYATMMLQAVCDHRTKFMDIHLDNPRPGPVAAATTDWSLFEDSHLGKHLCTNEWEVPVGYYLVGDGAYRLRKYLMTPYANAATQDQKRLNEALVAMGAMARRAFDAVKSRFARLKYVDASRADLVPQMVVAACVLHNIILEEEGASDIAATADVAEESNAEGGMGYSSEESQRPPLTSTADPSNDPFMDIEAVDMRNAVAKTLVFD